MEKGIIIILMALLIYAGLKYFATVIRTKAIVMWIVEKNIGEPTKEEIDKNTALLIKNLLQIK